jgi:hypothetical protein
MSKSIGADAWDESQNERFVELCHNELLSRAEHKLAGR